MKKISYLGESYRVPSELKSTINLPKTDFPRKPTPPQTEPKMPAHWQEMTLYQPLREARRGGTSYVLHDGPPYANGALHLGHALGACLQDFIVRSKTMAGFDAPFVPGWDCHGLPIEIKVDQQLGGKKLQMKPLDVRHECRKYAQKFLDLQREQFKRIGCLGRYDRPYSTMTPEYESVVLGTFYQFFEKGFIYKGLRSVYLCIHDKTALAEAEVEYENHASPSIYVRYALSSDAAAIDPRLARKPVYTIIWTTTPWTMPASQAVACNRSFLYVALENPAEGKAYIVAKDLAAKVMAACDLEQAVEIAEFPGSKVENAIFRHPFLDRDILGVLADYVTLEQGTGVVHTAPSHGADDFVTGVKYGLDLTTNVDEAGIIRNGLPEYNGLQVFKANKPIIELLQERGALLNTETVEHSYPHCWRCHNPIIFRATELWFIRMDTPMEGETFRNRALEEIGEVKWDPAWGVDRISNMVAGRPDWCISRQRIWGVPIAVFLCEGCGQPLNEPGLNRKVVEFFAREGADGWYKPEADQILPAAAKCPQCGVTKFKREMDIFDVWFESGCSQAAVLGREPGLLWPADLYLEGGDQYRGWFQSSLLCAVGARWRAPYRMVVTHGWTLDEQGRAMSKSRGTDVDPVDIANRMGAEIVRLWVASVDFREDVVGSEHLMQRVAENYRTIRNNLFRYVLGNLYDFNPGRDALPFEQLHSIDQYMLRQTCALAEEVVRWYDEFAFHKIYQRINHFCVVELSAFYFDVLKDRLYTYAPNSTGRRAAQTAIWRIGEALARLLAPIMCFTCDEVWQHLRQLGTADESVHLTAFPSAEEILGGPEVAKTDSRQAEDWTALLAVREQVNKSLEDTRNQKTIGKSLEAQVKLAAAEPLFSLLKRYEGQLRYLFIVSSVTLEQGSGNGSAGVTVQVERADGQKCERCWNYSTRVGEDATYPTICERCSAALAEMAAPEQEK